MMRDAREWLLVGLTFLVCFILGLISTEVGSYPIFLMFPFGVFALWRAHINNQKEKKDKKLEGI